MRTGLISGAHTPMMNLKHWQNMRVCKRGRAVMGVRQAVQVLAIWMLMLCSATNLTFATDPTPGENEAHLQPVNKSVGTEGTWRHEVLQLGDRLISRAPNVWKGVGFVAHNVSSRIATFRKKLSPYMPRSILPRKCMQPDGNPCPKLSWAETYERDVFLFKLIARRCTVKNFVAAADAQYQSLREQVLAAWEGLKHAWDRSKQLVRRCSNATWVGFDGVCQWMRRFSAGPLKQTWHHIHHASIALWTTVCAAGTTALQRCQITFGNTGEAAKTVIIHGILLPTRKCYAYWTVMVAKVGKPLIKSMFNLPSHFATVFATSIPQVQHLMSRVSQWIKTLLQYAWAKHQKVWAFQTRMARALWREAQAAFQGRPEGSADRLRHATKRVVSWWDPDSREDGGGGFKGTTSQIEQEKNFARWKAAADSDEIGHDDDEI